MASILPKVTQLSSRVIRILGCNPGPMTLQGTNTYIIGIGKRRILVDTGDRGITEYISILQDILKKYSVELSHVVVTHWHHDHIGGVKDLICNGIVGKGCEIIKVARHKEEDGILVDDVNFKYVEDGNEIITEGASLTVIHTPGHTEDHMSLLLKEEQSVFSGDCILGEGTAVFEDLFTYINSLRKILKIEPKRIYPGHGPVVENGSEKILEYINHRMKREQQILGVMLSDKTISYTPMELVKIIYKDTPEHLYRAAVVNVSNHLSKLLKEEKAVESDGRWKINSKEAENLSSQ